MKKNDEHNNSEGLFYQRYPARINNLVSRYFLMFSDVLVFIAALILSRCYIIPSSIIFYQMGTLEPEKNVLFTFDWHYITFAVCIFYFRVTGNYTRRQTLWEEAPKTFFAISLAAIFDFLMLSISSLSLTSFDVVRMIYFLSLLKWVITFLALLLAREATKRFLSFIGVWQKPTVIVGIGNNAKLTYLALSRQKILGFDIRAFIDLNKKDDSDYSEIADLKLPILKIEGKAGEFFSQIKRPHVVIAVEEKELKQASHIIDDLTIYHNALDVVPPVRGMALYGLDMTHMFGSEILLLRSRNNLARFFPRVFKRCFDIVATTAILITISPLFLLFIYLIRKDGGNAFYGHKRIGQNGNPFYCYKFRSMIFNADKILADLLEKDPEAKKEWEKDFKLKKDPRITKIGQILRKTSLDELPQLINVLRGEMSLVGPRPVVAEEIKKYGDYDKYYKEVKPGITGLWQISGRNDVDYSYRVRLDVWYIKNWSFWYDIVILLKTIPAVFKKDGAY
ncbi:MAG: undecaprenyl-phosphate galactose phosphotransferase WbaP [Alphaproteobacteria bacterium]